MMTKCPQCGSAEIVPDLIVFGEVTSIWRSIFVSLVHPAKKGEPVNIGFRVAVCGTCGHAEMYTRAYQDLLDAYKKGYSTRELP